MYKIKATLLTCFCVIITAVAYFNVGTNCLGMIYEPEIPESLRK